MPKHEKTIHLDIFRLYMESGGMCQEFLSEFEKKTGKSEKTAYRWEKDFNWKERAKQPIQKAVEELEASQKLDAEELITGLLDLCKNRMDGLSEQASDIKAVLAQSFRTGKNGKPLMKTKSIAEATDLIRAQSRLTRDEITYMRLVLTLVGKPETIMEERMIVEFAGLPEGFYDDSSSDSDAADVQAGS